MLEGSIDDRIRQQALEQARQRNEIARKWHRMDGKFDPDQDDLTVAWIGSIGEVYVNFILGLPYAQPPVVDGVNTRDTDFIYKGEHVEVKTAKLFRPVKDYWIEVKHYKKKDDITDKILCLSINNIPSLADKIQLIGLIENYLVDRYPIKTHEQDSRVKSPAYFIPVKDLTSVETYFRDIL